MKRLCITLLLITSAPHADAARYARTWTDYTDAETGFALERTYNSQSLTNGSFGFGWCSELETTLQSTRDGRLKLRSCREQKEIVFSPTTPLAHRVLGSPDRRPAFSPRDGAPFLSSEAPGERVEMKNDEYHYYKNGSVQKRFDHVGRLLEWLSEDGVINRVRRNVYGDPISWETSRGFRLSLRAEPGTGRIRSILLPGGGSISYQYLNGNLVVVTKDGGLEWAHQYDELHNLTRSQAHDGFFESVTYDKKRDEVKTVRRGLSPGNRL